MTRVPLPPPSGSERDPALRPVTPPPSLRDARVRVPAPTEEERHHRALERAAGQQAAAVGELAAAARGISWELRKIADAFSRVDPEAGKPSQPDGVTVEAEG